MGSLSFDFKRHLTFHFPELTQGRSILALSGGIDSVVLLELLREAQIEFAVAHCNFGLRGRDSDQDQEFVEELARGRNLEVHTKAFDAKEHAKSHGLSVQMAARELRYQWFDELLDKTESAFLLTAHHADDNLETFLINLSRGAGLKGLTGIPERNDRIRRPLLRYTRKEIEAFALEKGLSWREDQSNAQNKYLRNRIRNELVPLMKESLPELLTGFGSTLNHLKESSVIVNDRLEEVWEEITEARSDLTAIDIAGILSLTDPKAYLYGFLSKFGFTQWTDIEELLTAQSGKMIFSPTHRLLKDRQQLLLQNMESLPDAEQSQLVSLNQPSIDLPSGTLRLQFEKKAKEEGSKYLNRVTFDADKVNLPMVVRKWQKGDYFYPKGMMGKKKLSKFFKDEKLSIPEKENIWLLCSENEVAWVVGLRCDERFKVTDETESVLLVEWIPK